MNKRVFHEKELMRLAHSVESELGFWEWDIPNDVVTWSPSVYKIFGLNDNEFDGTMQSYRKFLHPEDLPMIEFTIGEAVRLRKNYTFKHRLLRDDNSVRWLEAMGNVVVQDDQPIKIVGFVRDITEDQLKRNLSDKLIETQNKKLVSIAFDLQRKISQLEEFAHVVSHNLKSPINNIIALIEFHEQTSDEDERSELFKLIKIASGHIQSTIREVSDVLVIQQNKNVAKRRVYFEEVFQKTITMLHAKVQETKAEISYHFDVKHMEYPGIYMESIFLNLMSNAIKYAKPSCKPIIEFSTYTKDDEVFLQCRDNGLGIDLSLYGDHIFKMHRTFHRHPDGQGMGLFIIKNQVEAMKGTISVQSTVNSGSTFIINFGRNASKEVAKIV
jgi:PAS domain S-box-containing protein